MVCQLLPPRMEVQLIYIGFVKHSKQYDLFTAVFIVCVTKSYASKSYDL